MKDHELLDTLGGIDPKWILQAAEAPHRKMKWLRLGTAIAACALLAVGVSLTLRLIKSQLPNPIPTVESAVGFTIESSSVQSSEKGNEHPSEPVATGIQIPPITLSDPGEDSEADIIGGIIYQGNVYIQAGSYYGDDALRIEPIIGEHLGYATGTLREDPGQPESSREFASTFTGDVFTVTGYDPAFRICIRKEIEGPDGIPTLWIEMMERMNGIEIAIGKDVFEDLLHLEDHIDKIQWQAHTDWDYNQGNIHDATISSSEWEAFLAEINCGEFICAWEEEGTFYADHPNSTIFDTPNQAHLYLHMDDGTVVNLRLIEGGYVEYDSVSGWWYFVRIPEEIFDKIYDQCGGTHIKEW